MLTDELLKQVNATLNRANPSKDKTRTFTLTGAAVALPNESCKYVTILNITGANLVLTVNSGDNFTLPNNVGATLFCSNTNLVTVNGTLAATLQYIISE